MRKLGFVIYWIVAAAVILGASVWAANRANGQCGPGGCPSAVWGQPQRPVWPPARAQQSAVGSQLTSETPAGYKAATVRITNQIGRARSIGSGVMVRHEGKCAILTANHIFSEGAGRIWITTSEGEQVEARLCGKDRVWDMAVLSFSPPPGSTLVQLASKLPAKGDALESCGYGSDGRFAVNRGKFVAFRMPMRSGTPDWLELTGRARQGDSGGPIFDDEGKLAGVLFGTNNRIVNGVSVGRLRVFLERWTGKGTTEGTEGAEKKTQEKVGLFSRDRERPLLPIPQCQPASPSAANSQSPIPNPSSEAGCLLPLRRPTPAPLVPTITVGGEVRQSLENLEAMAVQRNDQLQRIVQNTTPPEKPAGAGKPGGLGLALAIGAALLLGVVLFYSTQSHTPV